MAKRQKTAAPTDTVPVGEAVARTIIKTLERYGAQRFDNSTTKEHAIAAVAAIRVPVADE